MGEKDITEKILEAYNDVFSDILNVLLFGGKRIVLPEDLEDQLPRSMYKADEKIREIERDVVKRWKKHNIRIACIGIENQSAPDRYMTLRVAGYDGNEYRAQMINYKEGDEPYPVITLVLYFGYHKRWDQPKTLYEALKVTEELKPFVNDVKLNLFEIAYLSREQVNQFQSDFKVVADYFVQMQENGSYEPSTEKLDHIQAVLQLLNVMEKDHRFEEKINDEENEKEARTMSEWLTKKLNESLSQGMSQGFSQGMSQGMSQGFSQGMSQGMSQGFSQGMSQGMSQGFSQGEAQMGRLINQLLKEGRTEDISRATEDPEYRKHLYQEFQIA